jgi:hypothetical protein
MTFRLKHVTDVHGVHIVACVVLVWIILRQVFSGARLCTFDVATRFSVAKPWFIDSVSETFSREHQ